MDNRPTESTQEPQVLDYAKPAALDRRALLALFVVVLGGHIGFGMIIPLLPLISRRFIDDALAVGVLFSVYSVCQLVSSPLLGALSDKIGRRPVLVVSQVGSAAGYVLLAFTLMFDWGEPLVGFGLVLLSRVIDGATAGNVAAAQAYVNDVAGGNEAARSRALGLLGASFGIGFTLGPGIAAVLTLVSDSAAAWAAAGFALFGGVAAWVLLKEPERQADESAGGFALAPANVARVVREPRVGWLIGAWFLAMLAFVMVEPTMPLLLADVFGFGELGVGLFFLGLGLVIIVVQGGLIGKLTDRFGEWTLVIVGPTLVIGAMACYGLLPWAAALPLLIGAGLLGATGRSIHTVASAGLIGRYAEGGRGGATYGVYNGAASLARVVGPLLATFLYDISAAATFATAAVIMLAAIAVLAWRRAIENPAIGYTGAEASSGA